MILRIKGFDLDIKIEENMATVLTILNKKVLNSIIRKIFDEIAGSDDNDIILEENCKLLNFAKDVTCITDYFNYNFKEKNLTNTIYKYIDSLVMQDYQLKLEIEAVSQELGKMLYILSQELDFGFEYDSDLAIPALLKMFNFSIDINECSTVLDRLLLLIDIYAFLHFKKVLIFINMKSFFDMNDIEIIYRHLMYKKINFICIESYAYDKMNIENSYIIDEDLIEFDYSK